MIYALLLATLLAYNEGGKTVIETPAKDYSHVQIDIDGVEQNWGHQKGSGSYHVARHPEGTTGSFFGVLCANDQCIPYDFNFTIGRRTKVPVTDHSYLIIAYGLLGILVIIVGALAWSWVNE